MQMTRDTLVADLASAAPATIRVFQKYRIDFCCGGKVPLAEAAEKQGLDAGALIADLEAATVEPTEAGDWQDAPLADLVGHIQRRYHEHLRAELPRLSAMLDKVVSRHGDRLPETLLPLQSTFEALKQDLLEHMTKEDLVLFPAIVEAERHSHGAAGGPFSWIDAPVAVMEAEHEAAGAALAMIRDLTHDFTPPQDACPTFRGLYHGLWQLEADMHMHVHLENNILFPRALAACA